MKHHKNLTLDSWSRLSTSEKMANIGSEVFRTLSWSKKNKDYAQSAFERSLELFDLSLETESLPGLREFCRAREAWVDYFTGENSYHTSEEDWQKYFYQFAYLSRNDK